jgi:hypothetical protein
MKPEEQRIAIAEACGWGIVKDYGNGSLYGYPNRIPSYDVAECPPRAIPDYLTDLNAMHEAEKVLNQAEDYRYRAYVLPQVCGDGSGLIAVTATATQRAEAFLRSINKWRDA